MLVAVYMVFVIMFRYTVFVFLRYNIVCQFYSTPIMYLSVTCFADIVFVLLFASRHNKCASNVCLINNMLC